MVISNQSLHIKIPLFSRGTGYSNGLDNFCFIIVGNFLWSILTESQLHYVKQGSESVTTNSDTTSVNRWCKVCKEGWKHFIQINIKFWFQDEGKTSVCSGLSAIHCIIPSRSGGCLENELHQKQIPWKQIATPLWATLLSKPNREKKVLLRDCKRCTTGGVASLALLPREVPLSCLGKYSCPVWGYPVSCTGGTCLVLAPTTSHPQQDLEQDFGQDRLQE